ncbi:hypothetical protein SAICODRAFT_107075 [Saitoella complicata NRRL Y-17804]|uniref:uncharacterized protein n=1 Tax=Saitoella complicata (strain BCRC 22490 / CBS 7301 / JCM 7358 / NBRC 10748 / NRRL Y-17804) TaxID=698492 RepID=UPI0008675BAE|nr:uncharacterized protein SAICODRAFT_107075 [Saitoella complicata NRRL Y-17804]ODQ56337.1 hypothetical protein SAICODRAFT_107075 [Saitoella complicata NRRL Y-17804]
MGKNGTNAPIPLSSELHLSTSVTYPPYRRERPKSQGNTTEHIVAEKRASKACDRCRMKKGKCDGTQSGCSRCLRNNQLCTYSERVVIKEEPTWNCSKTASKSCRPPSKNSFVAIPVISTAAPTLVATVISPSTKPSPNSISSEAWARSLIARAPLHLRLECSKTTQTSREDTTRRRLVPSR